jgi:hypothetical protein
MYRKYGEIKGKMYELLINKHLKTNLKHEAFLILCESEIQSISALSNLFREITDLDLAT